MLIVCDLNLLENAQCDYIDRGAHSADSPFCVLYALNMLKKNTLQNVLYTTHLCVCV